MKQLFSIFLATLMLVSNMGVTLATHYCGGKAVMSAFALGEMELSCGMSADDTCTHSSGTSSDSLENKTCCQNKYLQLDVDDVKSLDAAVAIDNASNNVYLVYNTIQLYSSQILQIPTKYEYYSPPLIERDIIILVQSYLI
ncbi:MAG: hypothetical protein COA49_05775 [Bacteroidetes bacterium]|nr:MAG: hypothetical protein COA49_05775 [Bacteroidota bacterium]